MGELFLILISTSLANNVVLTYMLGVDPLLATSGKSGVAVNTCLFMVLVMPVVAAITYVFNFYLFAQFIPGYLHLTAMVILISIIVMLTAMVIQNIFPSIFFRIEKIIPLMLVNSTLLGLILIGNKYVYSIISAFFFGLGTALGFSLILMMFISIRKRLNSSDIPHPVQGIAILFITLGLLSMGFMGLSGISLTK